MKGHRYSAKGPLLLILVQSHPVGEVMGIYCIDGSGIQPGSQLAN
jgi:hypothetical protein